MAKISGGELLVHCLLKEEVKYVFGIPGGQLCTFLDAIQRTGKPKGLDFIMTRHEEAAAHMADAYARLTGKVGVCTGTFGPGAGNLVSGVATAFDDSIPVLVITPQGQSWLSYPSHGSQQELDQFHLFKPITKWNAYVSHYKRIPELVQRAFRVATSSRPGPVHLDFALDVLFEAHDEEEALTLCSEPSRYRASLPPAGNEQSIKEAAKMLVDAKLPLIYAGGGVLRADGSQELIELATYLSIPLSTSNSARGAIPEDHPLALHPLSPSAIMARGEADVVLAVGTQFGQLEFFGRPPGWGDKAAQKVIQIDIDPEMIGFNREIEIGIVGDAKVCLNQLLKAVKKLTAKRKPEVNEKLKEYQSWQKQFFESSEETGASDQKPIHPLRLIKDVRDFFPRDSIVAVDGGTIALWANYLCNIYEPRTYLWAGGMGQLGAGLPFALAAKLVYPDRHVFIIHGDGSFMFMNQELETARRCNLPVIDIIANDNAYGMIKAAQAGSFENRLVGVDFYDVRYDKMAEAMGCYGERVEDPQEIVPALKRAVESGRPAVLDVMVDKDITLTPLHMDTLFGLWLEGVQMPPYK